MSIKSSAALFLSRIIARRVERESADAAACQSTLFRRLVQAAAGTSFGKQHLFSGMRTYDDFRQNVPLRDYEQFMPYLERIIQGEGNVIWPGRILYLSKTSGTTSGVKYIPISQESMPYHIRSARNALMMQVARTGDASCFDGKMIFLSGSPELEMKGRLPSGRLSGIVHRHVPAWLQSNRLPSRKVNCIEDWEEKVDAIVEETLGQDLRLISGIPPWVQMYFDRLMERTGRKIGEVFPNFSLMVHGGVNFEPYRARMEASIGRQVSFLETYPASEGFIAFQDVPENLQRRDEERGLLLLVNNGIFFEFVPAGELFSAHPSRVLLENVEPGVNYAIILSTNAGLWGYVIGDTVRFVSLNPYRIVVTGRVKHFISAFGEHVIAEEVERSLMELAKEHGASVIEFTVAPQVSPPGGELPYHEWFIEFGDLPGNMQRFASELDERMRNTNIYYNDLVAGKILQPLKLRVLRKDAFREFMKSKGKLGGQNKVPRLCNDRVVADDLAPWIVS